MNIYIIDSETTGLKEPIQPIEIAYLKIEYPSLKIEKQFDKFYKPTIPIEFGVKATTHILESDISDCDEVGSINFLTDINPLLTADYIIGHHCDYDWKVLGSPNVKRICTKAIATKVVPDIDSKSQSALMYYFYGDAARDMIKNAHNALCDIINCRKLLMCLLKKAQADGLGVFLTIEDLWEFSEDCRVPEKITFGKYRGQTYLKVAMENPSYFDWWRNKSDTPPDYYQEIAITKAFKERLANRNKP